MVRRLLVNCQWCSDVTTQHVMSRRHAGLIQVIMIGSLFYYMIRLALYCQFRALGNQDVESYMNYVTSLLAEFNLLRVHIKTSYLSHLGGQEAQKIRFVWGSKLGPAGSVHWQSNNQSIEPPKELKKKVNKTFFLTFLFVKKIKKAF